MPEGTSSSTLRVLVVEDFEPLRKITRAAMSRSGSPTLREATLAEAADLAQARSYLTTETFDVVLLDLTLPDGGGLELLPDITRLAGDSPPTVIAASGDALAQTEALRAGCAAFLLKPYSPTDLVTLLAEHSPVPVMWG